MKSTHTLRLDAALDSASFVWALGSLCQLNRVPFDPNLLLQQCAPPYDLAGLISAAQALGFKTGQHSIKVSALAKQPLPCLALLHCYTPSLRIRKPAMPVLNRC